MKKLLALLLTLALVLPCAALFAPAEAKADQLYIIPGSDTRKLTKDEIREYSYDTLMFAFNEIYARHGRRFADKELQAYFDAQSWYYGTIDPADWSEKYLNDYETYNVGFISKCEKTLK